MVNEAKLKQDALTKIQTLADEMEISYKEEIKRNLQKYAFEEKSQLMSKLAKIYENYKQLESEQKTGDLEWIYFSFLHTALLDSSPCYRIDFYDSRNCISVVECAGYWNHYIFDYYYRIEQMAADLAKRQTRLVPHEIDHTILYGKEEVFRKLADDRVCELICSSHSELTDLFSGEKSLKIMLGDYLDKAELVDEIPVKRI